MNIVTRNTRMNPFRHQPKDTPKTAGVILSGIDPLSNSDRYSQWITRLGRMPLQVSQPTFKWQRKLENVVPFKKEQDDAA